MLGQLDVNEAERLCWQVPSQEAFPRMKAHAAWLFGSTACNLVTQCPIWI